MYLFNLKNIFTHKICKVREQYPKDSIELQSTPKVRGPKEQNWGCIEPHDLNVTRGQIPVQFNFNPKKK